MGKKEQKKQTVGFGEWVGGHVQIQKYVYWQQKAIQKGISASVHSVLDDRILKHSEKPNSARERIVKLCGDIPRIELFARQRVDGWDSWGNEV